MKNPHSKIIDGHFTPVGNHTRKALGIHLTDDDKNPKWKKKKKEPKSNKVSKEFIDKRYERCPYCKNLILKNALNEHIEFKCRMKSKREF